MISILKDLTACCRGTFTEITESPFPTSSGLPRLYWKSTSSGKKLENEVRETRSEDDDVELCEVLTRIPRFWKEQSTRTQLRRLPNGTKVFSAPFWRRKQYTSSRINGQLASRNSGADGLVRQIPEEKHQQGKKEGGWCVSGRRGGQKREWGSRISRTLERNKIAHCDIGWLNAENENGPPEGFFSHFEYLKANINWTCYHWDWVGSSPVSSSAEDFVWKTNILEFRVDGGSAG